MSRLNLKAIISWVDSHIIDYPTASFFYISSISFFLLVFISPILSLLWLLFPTGYFLYRKKYKDIFIIWGMFLFIWYFFFTACVFTFEDKILIQADYFTTRNISCEDSWRFPFYLMENYSTSSESSFMDICLSNFCMQTFFILALLSNKLGINIYIPSLLHGLVYLFKFIFGRPPTADCSPGKESKESPYPSPNPSPTSIQENVKSFFGKGKPPTVSEEDICKKLRKGLGNSSGCQDKVVKGKKFFFCKLKFFSGDLTFCSDYNASADQIKKASILRDHDSKKK